MNSLIQEAKSAEIMVEVRDLVKEFGLRQGFLAPQQVNRVVHGVSFGVPRGRTLALVGESGSGKSTIGLMILDLLQPTSGEILLEGTPISARRGKDKLALRRQMQIVFQDPYASLNARLTVREMLFEAYVTHRIGENAKKREELAVQLLEDVGMSGVALDRYPHEFSGGQRQRIAIARALSVSPSFIVLDEPTSALDVSVQSQILNLLRRLQREHGLTYLFITHNLGVVDYFADEVVVMEQGRIVERGSTEAIFDNPQQDYTRKLLDAVPSFDPNHRKLTSR
ncbi:MAG TPA: ATP-binding cassette domain-containing protein [Abditibacterium sp.]